MHQLMAVNEMDVLLEEGLASANFDVEDGLSDGDVLRLTQGMAEVRQLMQRDGMTFDEARLQIVRGRMALMGVDSSGMPLDPKTFTFDKVDDTMRKPWRNNDAVSSSSGGWRSVGSRRTVITPGFKLPRIFTAPEPVDSDSPGASNKWSMLAAGCKAVKPVVRQTMFIRASVLVLLAIFFVMLRMIGYKAESMMPWQLVQNEVPSAFGGDLAIEGSP
eukprot:TRINITY_DN66068_c0_g1_i1.p1 TRINITY_DN66068_c0_g1~~TRINITY_DN66068_c0_g1_i1.p1  ORF type:complete len:227 (-),score=54.39 TRINITY_DN66068_c0_g1_i1:227-877(-)